jgi:hypothetical protein
VAKRNKSALKANRQNIKRREHNASLRAKLRTGLKGIRKSLDAKDVEAPRRRSSRCSRWSTRWPPRASSTRTPRRATSRGSRPESPSNRYPRPGPTSRLMFASKST